MDLEKKIMNLYQQEYKTVKQQRVLDILKVIFVDKETEPDKIVNLTSTTLITIEKYSKDKELMTQFLTEVEYEMFKQRVESIISWKQKNKKDDDEIIVE